MLFKMDLVMVQVLFLGSIANRVMEKCSSGDKKYDFSREKCASFVKQIVIKFHCLTWSYCLSAIDNEWCLLP